MTMPGAGAAWTPPMPPHRPRANGLAVAGLVCGILWVFWLGSILAVVLGHLAREQIDASGGVQRGRGMATAAVVLGWLGLTVLVAGLVAAIVVVLAA